MAKGMYNLRISRCQYCYRVIKSHLVFIPSCLIGNKARQPSINNFDKTLLSNDVSIGRLFLLVKGYYTTEKMWHKMIITRNHDNFLTLPVCG